VNVTGQSAMVSSIQSTAVFGPVPSRRLGRSLGVDLVPFKTCSYDCVYCQLGRTKCKTIDRRPWGSTDEIVAEVGERLSTRPDYITLSGSGEPTLNLRIGDIIENIKQVTNVPVAVLTNGSLFWQREVRRELLAADLVIPSLDAGDEATFQRVNRPHEAISLNRLFEGLIAFRKQYRGDYWLEVFLLNGSVENQADMDRLAKWAERIRPDRIQLNTTARPPAEPWASAVSADVLTAAARMFRPRAEVIAKLPHATKRPDCGVDCEAVSQLLRRRPCTFEDLAEGLAAHPAAILKCLDHLIAHRQIQTTRLGDQFYYCAGGQL
jgi:wyosine [tRNA(Phe)-imidazoG37] synthetase (radical SAM superfamily)